MSFFSSLKFRLCFLFTLLLLLAWVLSAVLSWKEAKDVINEFFDTQQMLFAKRLATADIHTLVTTLPNTKTMLPHNKKARGKEDDDSISFALFSNTGLVLLTDGEKGADFPYAEQRGFINMRIRDSDELWRIVWLSSPNGLYVVAVGQELDYRNDMVEDILSEQLYPWLWLLPILLVGIATIVIFELFPLRTLARQLANRQVDDGSALVVKRMPAEVRPLVTALNDLFARMHSQVARERAFTADAAHELRSPMAAMRVQAEVAQLTRDPAKYNTALEHLLQGIDRTANLIDQLLILTKLDDGTRDAPGDTLTYTPATSEQILHLVHDRMHDLELEVQTKNLRVQIDAQHTVPTIDVPISILEILIRNILDNAVRYTPQNGTIQITFTGRTITCVNSVAAHSPVLAPAIRDRLTERFYRPPGQTQHGSGLGLSIIQRISEMYSFTYSIQCISQNSNPTFALTVSFPVE